jgi:hypothetical protein
MAAQGHELGADALAAGPTPDSGPRRAAGVASGSGQNLP